MGKVFGKVVDHERDVAETLGDVGSEAFYRKILQSEENSEMQPFRIRGPSVSIPSSSSSSSASSTTSTSAGSPKRISPIVPGASNENQMMVARHKRIIKELTMLQASENLRVGIELRDVDLSLWYVELYDLNLGTLLVQDMNRQGMDHVLLELCFTKEFPYSPPALRIVSPTLSDPTQELLKWDGVVKSDRLASDWSKSKTKTVEWLLQDLEKLIRELGVELKKS